MPAEKQNQLLSDLDHKLWTAPDRLRTSWDAAVYYIERNVFWVPALARWKTINASIGFALREVG